MRLLAACLCVVLAGCPILGQSGIAHAQSSAPGQASDATLASKVALPLAAQATPVAENPKSWMADQPDYFRPFDMNWADGRWWVSGYFGPVARNELSQIVFHLNPHLQQQYVALATLGREFGSIGNVVRLEWDTGIGFHFGTRETFVDVHALVGARWIAFPWNAYLPTTFAVLTGPSLASKKSHYEIENGHASYYKNGLMLELTLAPPDEPDWMFALRIHHRSSIFGLIPDAGTPSDYVTIGLKHRF